MTPPDRKGTLEPKREESLFQAAAHLTGAERVAFLNGACHNNLALRQRIEALLAAHEAKDAFVEPEEVASGGEPLKTMKVEMPEDQADEAVGQTLGRYKLLERVGEGGCGVVYVAEQTEPVRRRVALKVIKLGMDTKQVVARFEAERQALAMMDHPNIAKVLDAGTTEVGRPYFVMELVRGIRITEYCDQNNLTTKERLDLFIKVCQAIQHAHQKGIIHRDIKPSNILVTLHDGVPVPKVIDFGIAKATEGRLTDSTVYTQLHQFIGTPAYMSPEQAEMSGLDIDTRSDIYSLGVLLYELLAGSTPFDAKELIASGIDAMRKTIREKEPVRPSTRFATLKGEELTTTAKRRSADTSKLMHQLKGDLDWIVMKCLEKDRTRRYETANGLAADLQRHLNNEPVVARPPSAAYRFQKAFSRNRLAFGAGVTVFLALIAGLSLAAIGWRQTRIERDKALQAQRETEEARNGEQQQRVAAQSAQKIAETEQQRADTQARRASESQQQSRRLLYASDMNLAQQALKLNNLGKTRRLLDRHRPQSGEEDLRGWEWRYLWQLARSSALVTLTNRPIRGFDLSFSLDGTRLAVGWLDGQVDLWDVSGRRLIRDLRNHELQNAGRVAFSPVRNLLAATSGPNEISLHDLDSGQSSIIWRPEGQWSPRDLSFSQDGSKVIIYAGSTVERGDEVSVVNVSTSEIESRHPTVYSQGGHFGAARLSPDNQRLYLARSDFSNYRYSIQCIDLSTGKEAWQTEPQRDQGLAALAISPDGRVLASASGFEDPTIRIWDAATGQLRVRLDGHTGWVCKLAFTRDGRRLISAASDQSIRFWDADTWTEVQVLRGHTDEVHAVDISETAQLIASAGKDGNLILWKEDGKSAADGHTRLPENLRTDEVMRLDHARLLTFPLGHSSELFDLKRDSPPVSLPEIGPSSNVFRWFGAKKIWPYDGPLSILFQWNGTNQIIVRELRGAEFIQRGAITVDSGTRPVAIAYNAARQLLAWTELPASTSIHLASIAEPGRRIELRSDVPSIVPFRFSEDGKHLAAVTSEKNSLRVWQIETGKIVASINEYTSDATFAAGGQVLVVAINQHADHVVEFHDLAHPDQPPRRVPGRYPAHFLAVSPDDTLVALTILDGQVRLFEAAKGELIDSLHGHLNGTSGVAFSPDGRRLVSASGGREAIKLWDVSTRQELLTLSGTGSLLHVTGWSSDGDVILAGAPWQAWRAPSWEEIARAEAKKNKSETP